MQPRSKMGRPITLPGPVGDLARAAGGVQALAALAYVTPRTIRAWAHGEVTPEGPARARIDDLCRAYGVTAPVWRKTA